MNYLVENSENVIKMNDNDKVYKQIKRFLLGVSRNSHNTRNAYLSDIETFFEVTRNKSIQHLQKADLIYTIDEFEDFQNHLLDVKKFAESTVNRYLTSITELMKHLKNRGMVENIDFLNIKRVRSQSRSYDGLSKDEVYRVANFVENTGRKKTGHIKKRLILFSFDTCSRREECLSLKWNDFAVDKEDENKVIVTTRVKGNKIMKRQISRKHYDELLELKQYNNEYVFDIGNVTVDRMMNDIKDFLEVEKENRYITFHSFRKAGSQFIWEQTRDINQVRKMLGHKSIQTTELYINKNEEYGVVGGYSSFHGIDKDLYRNVSHDELLRAINNLNADQQYLISRKIDELRKEDKQ